MPSHSVTSDSLWCPGSSAHGISQARILEGVAIFSSRGSSWPRDRTQVSFIGRQILYHWASRDAPSRTWVKTLKFVLSPSNATLLVLLSFLLFSLPPPSLPSIIFIPLSFLGSILKPHHRKAQCQYCPHVYRGCKNSGPQSSTQRGRTEDLGCAGRAVDGAGRPLPGQCWPRSVSAGAAFLAGQPGWHAEATHSG